MHTLVVDSDEKIRGLLSDIMRSFGHDVTTCAGAIEACELSKKDHYPLILLGWTPPEMEGLEFCRKARARPDGDSSVIIMVTSRDKPEDLHVALKAGADDYIAKSHMNIDMLKVRLKIAEQQVFERIKRKEGEARLAEVYDQMEKKHDDMCSILSELNLGAMIVEKGGAIAFLNRKAELLFGTSYESALDKSWEDLTPLAGGVKSRISKMLKIPSVQREKVASHIVNSKGKEYWVDIEIKDDPQNHGRFIFIIYDVSEVHNLRNQLNKKVKFHGIIGNSGPMLDLRERIKDFSKLDWTVLIEGETGAGKELIAKAIHFSSDRKDKPFIAINTAGLSDSLLASQLFGHKRGSFTGAVENQIGLFESAEGGTLFLDEIGDISPNVQVSLLRALEERTIVRLGETGERKMNVRFITATNKNLIDEVAGGRFRSDLLYRIRVARVYVPPLRERREDIPALADHYRAQSAAATGKEVAGIGESAMRLMMEYDWPGNVRELKSAVSYATIHCAPPVIRKEDLPPEILEFSQERFAKEHMVDFMKMDITNAVKAAGGNHSKAARMLGISRSTLYRRLVK